MKKRAKRVKNHKAHKRWKWMAAATAASTAGVTASHAGLITVNLANNFISARDGNHLNADLTGDENPDITLTGAHFFYTYPGATTSGFHFARFSVSVRINGVFARGYDNADYPFRSVTLGLQHLFATGGYSISLTGSIPISFKDLHINNGKLTSGSLEVTVTPGEVELNSFSYNTPDQDSSLTLLALGAGGVLALRRSRTAQGNA
jgi:hypothetical protein